MKKIYKSILRYPGGKQKLITKLIQKYSHNTDAVKLAVEPFAGSAAFSIAMLESEKAENVAINDKDELVSSLWKIVFSSKADKLAQKIYTTDISLNQWQEIKQSNPSSILDKAFKCLYLNRTSFSGILRDETGPLGGKSQTSQYPIDCRFNREFLADRIMELSTLRKRVVMCHGNSYKKMYQKVHKYADKNNLSSNDILWYFDPPYYYKADKLYRHYFDDKEHIKLYKLLSKQDFHGQWLLSYDYSSFIVNLYSSLFDLDYIEQNYSCASQKGNKVNELIISNISKIKNKPLLKPLELTINPYKEKFG